MMPWRKAIVGATTIPFLQQRSRFWLSNTAHNPFHFKTTMIVRTIVISVGYQKPTILGSKANHVLWEWNSPRFFSSTNDRTTQHQPKSTRETNQSGGILTQEQTNKILLYEGPLAAPLLRLKIVSITTCALGLFGLPLTALLYGATIPAVGQLAVGGTAILATTGSTVALSYCLSPYVHTLEKRIHDDLVITATTRNIFAQKVETTFNPQKDVVQYNGWRPFCNFIAKGVPMYIHPELLSDQRLSSLLVSSTVVRKKENTDKVQP